MSNIILIIPPSPNNRRIARFSFQSYESKGNYLIHPREFLAITSCLKSNDTVSFIDGTCDRLSKEKFFNEISKLKGDILFFSLSNVCWDSDYYYFKETIKKFPYIPVFVTGDIFLDEEFRDKILDDCDGVVFEPYALDIEKMIKFRDNKNEILPGVCTKPKQEYFIKPKKMSFIHDGYPRHEVFLKPCYRFPFAKHIKFATVVTTYGCPNTCEYCACSNFPPAVRPHASVVSELEYLENLGIQELFIYDSTFGWYKKECIPLLEIMKEKFRFSWTCFVNHNTCTNDLLKLMREAGCHTIIIGIDSSNVQSLKAYKRRFDKDKLEAIISLANNLRMSVCGDFIIGLEDETEEDINRTIEYALHLPLDFASFNVIVPTPGTVIRENLKKRGIPTKDLVNFDSLGRAGSIGNKYLSGEQIIKLKNKAVRKFYMRPSLIFRRIRKTSSLEHFFIQFSEMFAVLKKSAVGSYQ